MTSVLQDVRYALRMLRLHPGFALIGILTLALAMGANTAIFSMVQAVLLRPPPYRDPDRLFLVWESNLAQLNQPKIFVSYRDFDQWRQHATQFESLAAYTWAVSDQTLTGQGEPRKLTVLPVTADMFNVLGVNAEVGRTFVTEDAQRGCNVVLTHSFWMNVLAGDRSRVGKPITIGGEGCTVLGVMPASFALYPAETELWILLRPKSLLVTRNKSHLMAVLGRLRPGATVESAGAELLALRRGLEAIDNDQMAGVGVNLRPIQEEFTWLSGRNLRSGLLLLAGAVGFVLLIACLNITNLSLESATRRRKELAMRVALGADRGRLVRQLLTESAVLALLGGALGVAVAAGCLAAFRARHPVALPPGASVSLSPAVLLFSFGLAALTAVLVGALPARQATRTDLNEVIKGVTSTTGSSRRLVAAIVMGQIALGLVLLTAAALLIDSSLRMAAAPLGFDVPNLLMLGLAKPSETAADRQFFTRLLQETQSVPAVRGAALASVEVFSSAGMNSVAVEGQPATPPERAPIDVSFTSTSPEYFDVLGISLLQGRRFTATDNKEALPVAIVNRAFVDRYFPQQEALGKHVRVGSDPAAPWITLVGIVSNVGRSDPFHEMGWLVGPQMYRPFEQQPTPSQVLLVRSNEPRAELLPTIRRVIASLDPNLAPGHVRTAQERRDEFLAAPRFRALLLAAFAGLALLLAALGTYGVLAQNVSQRQREIGIRMALGAQRGQVFRLVLEQGARLIAVGIALGVAGALASGRLLASFLYGVRAADPVLLLLVAAFLALVALVAVYIPARRAASVDPMLALREQ